MSANDAQAAVERLRRNTDFAAKTGQAAMLHLDDARAILAELAAKDAEIARLTAELAAAKGERAQIVAGNRVEIDPDGTLDEIVTDGGAHLENLDGRHWFLNCLRADGSSIAVWITGKVTGWEERDIPKRLRVASGAHLASKGE